MIEHNQLRQELEENEVVLQVLPMDDLIEEWKRKKNIKAPYDTKFNNIKNYGAGMVSPARDMSTAFRICKDLGIT